jgi:hypothetical protein
MNIVYFIAFKWRAFDGFNGLGYHLRGEKRGLFDLIFFFFDVF